MIRRKQPQPGNKSNMTKASPRKREGLCLSKICYSIHMYDYELIRSRRTTIAIEIDRNGTIRVRAPYNAGNLKIRRFIEEKSDWIDRTLRKISERRGADGSAETEMCSDERIPLSDSDIRTLADEARRVIPAKVAHYAGQIGVTYGRITIRHQRSRWGSCSTKGNLNFNCLLMRAPEEILDYVIVHELCHRKHMNHSREFWDEVARICPEYKIRRKWLRDHGDRLFFS